MKTVKIYHGYGADGRMVFPFGSNVPDLLVHMYTYETDDNTNINGVYRENNAVTGDEVNVLRGARSLSVGDVVDLDGNLFQCDATEWSYPTELPGKLVSLDYVVNLMASDRRYST